MAADISRPPSIPHPMRAIGFFAWGLSVGLLWAFIVVIACRHFVPMRVFSGIVAGTTLGAVLAGVVVARLPRLLQLVVTVGAVAGAVRLVEIVGTAPALPGRRETQVLIAAFVALGLLATSAVCGILVRAWRDIWRWLLSGFLFPVFVTGVLLLANSVIPDDKRTFFPPRRKFPLILVVVLPVIALTSSLGVASVPPRRWVGLDEE